MYYVHFPENDCYDDMILSEDELRLFLKNNLLSYEKFGRCCASFVKKEIYILIPFGGFKE